MEVRARNWAFIVYPSECHSDWLEKLKILQVPCAVSPLHTPTDEKPHHHILICGDKKSAEQIRNEVCICLGEKTEIDGKESIKGVTLPQKVLNLKSSVRYLLHLDDKDKQQFENEEIKCFGGFNADKYLIDEKEKKYNGIKGVITIIKENAFNSLLELLEYLGQNHDDLFQVCVDNAYLATQLVNYTKNDRKMKKNNLVLDALN